LLCYPSILQELYEESREAIQHVAELLSKSLEMPMIHAPDEVTHPRELFYDTVYHLTKEGSQHRSELLFSGLQHHLPKLPYEVSRLQQDSMVR
jgi:hypothetical protein